jgi:ABC-type transport system involved in multi-copper enzyme maturation permease subunit
LLTIAILTWREVLRRKLLAAAILLTILFLGLYGLGLYYANKEMLANASPLPQLQRGFIINQLVSVGIYFGSFIVSLLAIFSVAGTVSSEIEGGTVYAVLARPIKRVDFILGKLLGHGCLLVLFAAVFLAALSAIVYCITGFMVNGIYPALGLFCLQPLVLLSVAALGSVLFPTLANGIIVFMIYAIAVVGGMVEQFGWIIKSATMVRIGIVSSLIMPADALYRKIVHTLLSFSGESSLYLTQMGPFGCLSEPSTHMLVYTVLYIIGATFLAACLFRKKDIT